MDVRRLRMNKRSLHLLRRKLQIKNQAPMMSEFRVPENGFPKRGKDYLPNCSLSFLISFFISFMSAQRSGKLLKMALLFQKLRPSMAGEP